MTPPLLALDGVAKVYRRGLLSRETAFRLDVDRSFQAPNRRRWARTGRQDDLFGMIAGSNPPSQGRCVAGQDITLAHASATGWRSTTTSPTRCAASAMAGPPS
jgi:hypothetical protein